MAEIKTAEGHLIRVISYGERIAELEKENAGLKEQVKVWKALQELYDGKAFKCQEACNELRKENTELKTRLNAINLLTPELEKMSKLKKQQLTKAKELLNEFMRISKASDEDFEHDYSELIGEAEQFLKEIKEK